MSVLALPTYRQRPISAPSMNYEASIAMNESSSPEEVQPLLDREALLAAWPKRSALVVEEIVVTEKNYVESLHEVVMVSALEKEQTRIVISKQQICAALTLVSTTYVD